MADPQEEALSFVHACQTLVLATVSAVGGTPNCSYAPFVEHGGRFFILVSGLARHTANLLEDGRCHVMFIADEHASANIFARTRVSYSCLARPVSRNEDLANAVFQLFSDRFGPVVDTLRSLSDFQIVELTPTDGTFVRGFGQAMRLES